jgi:hypothetical protein
MPKLYLLILTSFIFCALHAQSDFIVFKKRHTTLQTFFIGSYASFYLVNDEWLNGYVRKMQHDSVYIKPFVLQVYYNGFGMPATDTMFMATVRISLHQIKGMPKEQYVSFVRDGSILEIGAGAYMFLNIINSIGQKTPIFSNSNLKDLGIAAGVFATGLLIKLLRSPYIKLGKKYHLDYINLHATSH